MTSDLSASAPAFTPAGGAAVPYVEVSATAPPPVDVAVEGTGGGEGEGESGGNVLTSMLFGAGKDGEEAPSSTVEGADTEAVAAATEGSPEKEKDGGVMNFFEKVAVAVGLVSSDDEGDETAAAAETTETAASETFAADTTTTTTTTAPSAST